MGQKSWLVKPAASSAAAACPDDLRLAVPRGLVGGIGGLNKSGRNPDVDTSTDPEDLWTEGGLWVAPTSAVVHDVESTSGQDTDGSGTGAHTVWLQGLDANWEMQEETVTMNGGTIVNTVNSYLRIFQMKVVTGGSNNANVGTITASQTGGSVVTAAIDVDPTSGEGDGQSLMAIYTVPASTTLYLTGWYVSLNRQGGVGGAMADFQLRTRDATAGASAQWQVKRSIGLVAEGGQPFTNTLSPYMAIGEKTDILIRCTSVTDNNSDVSGGFDGYLVAD